MSPITLFGNANALARWLAYPSSTPNTPWCGLGRCPVVLREPWPPCVTLHTAIAIIAIAITAIAGLPRPFGSKSGSSTSLYGLLTVVHSPLASEHHAAQPPPQVPDSSLPRAYILGAPANEAVHNLSGTLVIPPTRVRLVAWPAFC